jgi:hypothetical protein
MAGKVNFRIVTLVAALASSILCAIALAFLVTALVEFRAEDFFTASKTKDFTALGTCVETLTHDQLKELDYNNGELDCKESDNSGNRLKLINTLRATVHSVYYAYHHPEAMVDDGTNTGVKVHASTKHAQWGEYLRTVMAAQVGHVLGKTDPFFTSGVGGTQQSFINVGLNYSMVYEALKLVSEIDVPASCDDIYGMSYYEDPADATIPWISDDDKTFPQSATTQADPLYTGPVDGHYHDTEWEAFIKGIREGRLDGDEKTKSTWPLQEFTIDCPGDAQTLGQDYIPLGNEAEDTPLTDEAKKYMYAHCVAQFQFASVGTRAWEGTYGIPLPGIEAGPFARWYPNPDGFNGTSSYNMRARMYLGQRFGYSIWAYVPMFLALCFLLGDAIVFFLAEALMPFVLAEQYAFASNNLDNIRDSLVIAATTRSSRRRRLAIGYLAVIVAILFYALFIAMPWGFFYTSLPRPVCEKTDNSADPTITSLGTEPDHGTPQIFWKGTKGGWKADWDATWYDLAALSVMLFVLILLPLTTSSFTRNLNKGVNNDTGGRTTVAQIAAAAKYVTNERQYRRLQNIFFPIMAVGILIAIVGQSISGARFGMAWAEGVVAQEVDHDGNLIFDEVKLSEQVYDQTISTLAIVVAMGLVFAVVMQRHLVNGVGCFAAGLFAGWVVLVLLFCLPLMIYAASRSIFSEKSASSDCASFPRSSHEFENDLCVSRFWTLLVGGGIFLGTVAVITVLGGLEYLQALFKLRNKAAVHRPKPQELDPIMRATGPGNSQAAAYREPLQAFVNPKFKAKPKTANEFLYGNNKLYVPPSHR